MEHRKECMCSQCLKQSSVSESKLNGGLDTGVKESMKRVVNRGIDSCIKVAEAAGRMGKVDAKDALFLCEQFEHLKISD